MTQSTVTVPQDEDEDVSSHGTPQRQTSSLESIACRICQSATEKSRLISPCLCKGTLRYVHRDCLEHWLSRSGLTHCELCLHRYQTYTALRYSCIESLCIWYRHPNNRGLLLSSRGNTLQETLASTAIVCFLLLVLIVYLTNIVVLAKDHIIPWYRWWRSSRRIRLSELSVIEIPAGNSSHVV
ncbi:E3 ubiquitin-protein ligase MARCHF3-like isoform X2 [Topomyia yanbarensis]|uniref:E3 ubiquitin-protein ligase MARCHF3-like isoform X2 n=1 Tax=Topomyia yanbarensis TaxID=2498891 RepID=UPI00273B0EF9|nr:E3 ubiquitin-protein ligase MARCHF3-like isoform X2 [Topomyia yanbarensis]